MADRPDLSAFDEQAAQLAAHIAAAEAAGEPVPEQARAMLASLQDLSRAVDALRRSLGGAPQADEPEGQGG
jgi:hypothetical protein